jgi:predicted anti-sigma-YlaC factor YlaD
VPPESAQPDLRASDADRDEAVERLRVAALEGRLEADELESRLADAYGARTCAELTALTADITPPPEPLVFLRPARRRNALATVSLVAGLSIVFVIVGVLWLAWLGSLVAIGAGHVALVQVGRAAGTETGRARAVAGLCLGYFSLATLIFVLSFS